MIVEDEAALADIIASYLRRDGFEVTVVGDGIAAVAAVRADPPQVIILDLGLPGIDGVEVCRQVRTFADSYIIMLTARTDEVDTLVGLSVGADDYMTKPFSPREVVARVRAMLRRPRTAPPAIEPAVAPRRIVHGPMTINLAAREVHVADTLVHLTRTEFDLLEALATHLHTVLTRRQMLDIIWGKNWVGDIHIVDTHIGNMRRKLRRAGLDADTIRTVRGVGFMMGGPQ
ncbi:MAG: response regulator transcription factor [Gordonia polyisoprenivorans]|nr:response regulator transcription factor [Gordonia polyisoprenivorans]